MTCIYCLNTSKPSHYNPPEVQELMKYPIFSTMNEHDIMAFYVRYRGITKGQPFLNRTQFLEMLASFSLYPSRHVADRMFDIVDRDNSSQIDFIEFMKYIFLLLDGSTDEKSQFIFRMVAYKDKEVFGFRELAAFYRIVDADEDATKVVFSNEGEDEEDEQSEIMAASVFDIMGKKFEDKIDLNFFIKFIKENDQAILLFNFLNADLESTTKHVRIKGSYAQLLRLLENLQNDIKSLKETLQEQGLVDDTEPVYFKKQSVFNRTFCNIVKDQIKNGPLLSKLSIKDNRNSKATSEYSRRDSKRSNVTNLIKALGMQDISNFDDSQFGSENSEENFKVWKNKTDARQTVRLISSIGNRVDRLVNVIEREIDLMSREEKFLSELKTTFNSHNAETDAKKRVFLNNPNWNIVTTMISGINRSLSIISSDKYHTLSKRDFIYHNKIEVDSVYSNQFDSCQFKDYAPYVFQSMRRQYGISYESYIRSIGVNTFRNAFFDKLYLMLSETSTGKSGSFFFHTSDSRFMIKTIKRHEFETLIKILPQYHEHILKNPNTLLARYFGLHQLICYQGSKIRYDLYVIVMNNVFSLENPELVEQKYDLKGSTHRRITNNKEVKLGAAKKDINFISDGVKIKVDPSIKTKLMNTIRNDTAFLARNNIIDYSLLVGVISKSKSGIRRYTTYRPLDAEDYFEPKFDNQRNNGYIEGNDNGLHYYIGIIDTLTPFNAAKKSEFLVRRVFQGEGVSCVPPLQYKDRFVAFMDRAIDG